ncbi:MAG: adenosylcobinamide amidohydrolase [Desulfomonilaceae bacterium]|nr:adenosylcobinamide amidohydrolase [Desulfomonilaceae bacterium]
MRTALRMRVLAAVFMAASLVPSALAVEYPLIVTDMGGREVTLTKEPRRIVSVSPSVTEVIFALGAQHLLVGRTYHTTRPAAVNDIPVVGGYFKPSIEEVEKQEPDLIFLSRIHRDLRDRFAGSTVLLVETDTRSMADGYRMMELVGAIVGREREAAELIGRIRAQIDRVQRKVAKIPRDKRKRVIRLMGIAGIMTPGDDSFQNEFIRAAGGIPPSTGRNGPAVEMTVEEWRKFNPQLIYYCGDEWRLSKIYFDTPGWKDADAVRLKHFARFPCDFTCRASVHMGDFIAWLASVIYEDVFHLDDTAVSEDHRNTSEAVDLHLPYVKSAVITDCMFRDFFNRTLLIDFTEPMRCINTLEGPVEDIRTIGNHSLPMPLWHFPHGVALSHVKTMLCNVLERDSATSTLMYTGARMESLSVQKRSYKSMTAYALVTAGAETNAIRTGTDSGDYEEPGTINIIILTNTRLTPRAMTRALITATEAKTAALQDLDVRSSYTPSRQATGTGTDNIVVVEGRGPRVDNSGGHTKMGELIAEAVYAAVTDSLGKQNGLVDRRDVFRRMHERKIDLHGIAAQYLGAGRGDVLELTSGLEGLLVQPQYAGFLEAAFALSDAYRARLMSDLTEFTRTCGRVSAAIAGRPVPAAPRLLPEDAAPEVVRMAFEALLHGLSSAPAAEKASSADSKDARP